MIVPFTKQPKSLQIPLPDIKLQEPFALAAAAMMHRDGRLIKPDQLSPKEPAVAQRS